MATFPWGWAFSFLGFVGLMSAVLAPFFRLHNCLALASTTTFHIWYPMWVFADIVWCWQGCVSWWDDLVRAGHSKSSLMVHSFQTWIELAKSLGVPSSLLCNYNWFVPFTFCYWNFSLCSCDVIPAEWTEHVIDIWKQCYRLHIWVLITSSHFWTGILVSSDPVGYLLV